MIVREKSKERFYMARKKVETITGLGKHPDKLIVQKSLPLFALWQSELTLPEFKILDVYLSRINSREPDNKVVMLEKGELESILGVKKINNEDLTKRLEHLMGHVVRIPDPQYPKGVHLVTLFEEAIAIPDEYGIWQINLECTQKAMKYFFNVENLGYLRYKLRCIMPITSRYTYIMFLYLESNRFRKHWEVSLDELKQILGCNTEEYAKEFKYFNRDVLKKIHKEMHEKTECKYSYTPIKKGRTVIGIRFEVETLLKLETEVPEAPAPKEGEPDCPMWEAALKEWKLSQAQLDELQTLLVTVPTHKLPSCQKEDLEKAYYQYVAQKAAEIKRRNEQKRIRSRFSYLRKLMKDDIESKPPQEGKQQTHAVASGTQAFQNFTERQNNNYMDKVLKQYSQPYSEEERKALQEMEQQQKGNQK